MSKRPRRKLSAGFKAKVALAAVRGDKTLSELSSQYDVHPNQITQWKKQLLENVDRLFSKDAQDRGDVEAEVKELHAKIGELTMERDFLSKGLARVGVPPSKR